MTFYVFNGRKKLFNNKLKDTTLFTNPRKK